MRRASRTKRCRAIRCDYQTNPRSASFSMSGQNVYCRSPSPIPNKIGEKNQATNHQYGNPTPEIAAIRSKLLLLLRQQFTMAQQTTKRLGILAGQRRRIVLPDRPAQDCASSIFPTPGNELEVVEFMPNPSPDRRTILL